MGDKNLMENILLLEKGVCDLFLHGTIESSTSRVTSARDAFGITASFTFSVGFPFTPSS